MFPFTTRLALLCVAGAAAWGAEFSYEMSIGVVTTRAGHVCLSIDNASIQPNDVVTVVTTLPPQLVSEAKVVGRAGDLCKDETNDIGKNKYELKFGDAKAASSLPGIAVVGSKSRFADVNGAVASDIDGDGTPEFFKSCATKEGLHFTVWSGRPLRGTLRWHKYYYLGYDVEPDCTPAETPSGEPSK